MHAIGLQLSLLHLLLVVLLVLFDDVHQSLLVIRLLLVEVTEMRLVIGGQQVLLLTGLYKLLLA